MLRPNENENPLLDKLNGLVTNIKWSPEDVVKLFNALLKRFQSKTTDRSSLFSWMMEMLHCIQINYITHDWKHKRKEEERKTLFQLLEDKTVTDEDLLIRLADNKKKELDEILHEIHQEKLNQIDENILKQVKDIVSSLNDNVSHRSPQNGLKKDLLMLCQAVKKSKNLEPRLTQMVAWCIMALSDTGRLIQVGTGEGKSCIVAMFAAFRALRGEKVDVMSSSPVLAERDLHEWKKFYEHLNISVDCNTNKQETDKRKCYECQVVYGTVEEFAGDWLRQHFQRMDIFGQRSFQCAIVDEVDSLMLDKGLHVVYISSDMPALRHLNPVLASIWATTNQYTKIGSEITVGKKLPFHEAVLKNLTTRTDVNKFLIFQIAEDTGILAKGSVNDLRRNSSCLTAKTVNITVNQLLEFFKTVERRFPTCQFALHRINSDGAIEQLNQTPQNEGVSRVSLLLTHGGFCQYMYSDRDSLSRAAEAEINQSLHFTPCELSKDKSTCYVPGFLFDLVKSKLNVWIKNALEAQAMTMDHEYVMEKHGIAPVDYNCTGVVENFMTWSDGLHQFLEMKHTCKLSDMSVITNYMSNVGLLQMYGCQIFGMSGTLGQETETETLRKIYDGIKTCQIPSFKRRKLFEVEGVVVNNEEEWIDAICTVVTAQTTSTAYRGQRAVLVICETIKRAKAINKALGNKVPKKKFYINNNMDNTAIFNKKLDAGDVIIATNLAGRGTDLKVSDSVNEAGGLFVVQTFLPKNTRVEAQAFGRTARQGSPGCAQLVICSSHLSEPLQLLLLTAKLCSAFRNIITATTLSLDASVMLLNSYQQGQNIEDIDMSSMLPLLLTKSSRSDINIAKKVRDDSLAKGLTMFLECDIPEIKKKQELFNHYLKILDDVYKTSNNKPLESDVSALNEFWGMFLLMEFTPNKSMEELKGQLSRDMARAKQELGQRKSPLSNLHHYTAFGTELCDKGRLAESIVMYNKAIKQDPCWAAVAYYNRAFAALTQQDGNQDPNCIDQALQDLHRAVKSVELYCDQVQVTYKYSTKPINEPYSDAVTRFDAHMSARYRVLLFFLANINEAIKKLDRARDIGGNVKVDKVLHYFMVPLVHFLPLAVLSTESLTQIYSRDLLKLHQLNSHPSFDIVHELNSLEYLGLTHVYTLDTRFSLGGFFSKIHRTVRKALD